MSQDQLSNQSSPMTAEQAMEELWGTLCPDCGPNNYAEILKAALDVILKARKSPPAPTNE